MKHIDIMVLGLGYVGLPLALEFGRKFQTIGFDINKRIAGKENKPKFNSVNHGGCNGE